MDIVVTEILPRTGRHKYFHVLIGCCFNRDKTELDYSPENILTLLQISRFLKQDYLQDILHEFKAIDRGRWITLKKYEAQIEKDSETNFPFWRISCEVQAVITTGAFESALKEFILLKIKKKNLSNNELKVNPTKYFLNLEKKNQYQIKDKDYLKDWYPGYFDKRCVDVLRLVRDPFTMKFLKEYGYRIKEIEEKETSEIEQDCHMMDARLN